MSSWTVVNTKRREVIKKEEEVSDEKSNKVEIGESRRGKVTKVKSDKSEKSLKDADLGRHLQHSNCSLF